MDLLCPREHDSTHESKPRMMEKKKKGRILACQRTETGRSPANSDSLQPTGCFSFLSITPLLHLLFFGRPVREEQQEDVDRPNQVMSSSQVEIDKFGINNKYWHGP